MPLNQAKDLIKSISADENIITSHIGNINLNHSIVASDPSFPIDIYTNVILDNLIPGTYHCLITEKEFGEGYGLRVTNLIIIHQDAAITNIATLIDEVSVDGGVAGIFDLEYFQNAHRPEVNDEWHNSQIRNPLWRSGQYKNFNVTENQGVLTISGFGDGSYPLYVHLNDNNHIDAVRMCFIP